MVSQARTQPVRWLLTGAGYFLLGLGIVGFFVPGLPGTVFLIYALECFVRSNPRMAEWMLRNRHFGPILKDWIETGSISLPIKIVSVTCILVFSSIPFVRDGEWWSKLLAFVLATIGVVYILTRPTKRKKG